MDSLYILLAKHVLDVILQASAGGGGTDTIRRLRTNMLNALKVLMAKMQACEAIGQPAGKATALTLLTASHDPAVKVGFGQGNSHEQPA